MVELFSTLRIVYTEFSFERLHFHKWGPGIPLHSFSFVSKLGLFISPFQNLCMVVIFLLLFAKPSIISFLYTFDSF